MVSNLYAFIAFITVIVYILLIRCDYEIKGKEKEREERLFENTMIVLVLFGIIDGVWGLLNNQTIVLGRTVFSIASYLFHFQATISAYMWFRFSDRFLKSERKKAITVVESAPLIVAGVVIVIQIITGNTAFYVDEKLVYHTGTHRIILFAVQLFYFIYGFVKAVYRYHRDDGSNTALRCRIAMESMLITVITGIFQLCNPDAPYYSVGFMLASILVFNGSIVVEREKWSQERADHQEKTTKEVYNALEALGRRFVSIHLFDLKNDKQQMVKSTPDIEFFVKPEDPASVQITKVMKGVTDRHFTAQMIEFVDASTLSKRMKGKDAISHEFIGKNQGWCISSFIKVEENEDGEVTKVIHAVQNINEIKLREKEYEEALARAYMNKNAIYAEILKMQSTGVLATDMNQHILLANDMAMMMFNHVGGDYKKMSYLEFIRGSEYDDYEEAVTSYEKLCFDGTPITYFMKNVAPDGTERYLKADARKLEMLDKSNTIITCYTDITESKQMEDTLRILSETDALTHIANRRSGESRINLFLKDNVEGVFCLADIDKFKNINDSFGHHIGDLALIEMAAALRDSFRDNDVVMRIGGDEFAIFAKNVTDKATAEAMIDRLFKNISEVSIPEMGAMKIHISLGATFVRADEETTFDEMYQKADAVMYASKGHIGNCCTFYEE